MTLRQKILLFFSLTVIAIVVAIAWTVSVRVGSLFETLERDRTTALVNQFLREYQRRSDEVARRIDQLTKDERVTHMAYDLGHGGDASIYLTDAGSLAQEYQLDYLELVEADGSIVSSAQWPAHFGYKDAAIAHAEAAPFLKEESLDQDRSETGLFSVRRVPGAESTLDVVAGERLDSAFLASLLEPAGTTLYLYRNATPAFADDNLISSKGAVHDAARYMDIINRTRVSASQSSAILDKGGEDEESVDLTAIPLKAEDGAVIAILVVENSRMELVQTQGHIRDLGYGAAGAGILFAILTSLWIAARVSRPVEQLAQATRAVAAGDWDARVPVKSGDEIGQLAGSFNQMTKELVSQRERLIQSERVAAWRELARRLAHELKNPLFPLQLTVENMVRAKQVSPEMFEEVFNEGVAALAAEIANLKTIIERFSDFSKMPKPQTIKVDLRDVLARVIRLYEPMLRQREHPIQLVSNISREPLPVFVDSELMHRALSNLVLNAMDAMPDGGTLTIAAGRINTSAQITIKDTGQGMTVEEQERLFTPYYTTRQQGTGLGLAIVQSVIADHHGTILVETSPGAGTTFVIDLPAAGGESGERA